MPFAARHRHDPVPTIEPLPGLVVRRLGFVRAGRGSMACAPEGCRCDYQVPKSGCAA